MDILVLRLLWVARLTSDLSTHMHRRAERMVPVTIIPVTCDRPGDPMWLIIQFVWAFTVDIQ